MYTGYHYLNYIRRWTRLLILGEVMLFCLIGFLIYYNLDMIVTLSKRSLIGFLMGLSVPTGFYLLNIVDEYATDLIRKKARRQYY
jgi:glycopeptide antibiotics resistance protein